MVAETAARGKSLDRCELERDFVARVAGKLSALRVAAVGDYRVVTISAQGRRGKNKVFAAAVLVAAGVSCNAMLMLAPLGLFYARRALRVR